MVMVSTQHFLSISALNHNNEIPFRICTHLAIVSADNTNAGTCSLYVLLPIGRWSNLNLNYRELLLHYVKTRSGSIIFLNTIDNLLYCLI